MAIDKLKLRNSMKKRKPTFERQYANVMKKFKGSWNKPRGMHSKMRRGMRGKKLLPTVGFRSPNAVRGLLRTGFESVVVSNIAELQKIDPKTQVAVLAANLGMRKRVEFLNKAMELKIQVHNVKEPIKYVEEAKKEVADRKKISTERKNSKDKKRSEKEAAKEAEKKKEAKAEAKAADKKTEGVKSQWAWISKLKEEWLHK